MLAVPALSQQVVLTEVLGGESPGILSFLLVNVKWIEPHGSALDEFQTEVEEEMYKAETIEELLEMYREADGAAKEAGLPDLGADQATLRPYAVPPGMRHQQDLDAGQQEISARRFQLRHEILMREDANLQLFKLKFYWSAGLVSLLAGVWVLMRLNTWVGFSAIVVGFSEMLCWTSPLFQRALPNQQLEILLNYKLTLSIVTWIVLVAFWLLLDKGIVKARQE